MYAIGLVPLAIVVRLETMLVDEVVDGTEVLGHGVQCSFVGGNLGLVVGLEYLLDFSFPGLLR